MVNVNVENIFFKVFESIATCDSLVNQSGDFAQPDLRRGLNEERVWIFDEIIISRFFLLEAYFINNQNLLSSRIWGVFIEDSINQVLYTWYTVYTIQCIVNGSIHWSQQSWTKSTIMIHRTLCSNLELLKNTVL